MSTGGRADKKLGWTHAHVHTEFHSAFRRGESGVCGDMRHLPSLRLCEGGRTQGGDLQGHFAGAPEAEDRGRCWGPGGGRCSQGTERLGGLMDSMRPVVGSAVPGTGGLLEGAVPVLPPRV